MSKCIGGIVNDSVDDLLTHSPSKSFGNHSKTRMRLLFLLLLLIDPDKSPEWKAPSDKHRKIRDIH